MEVVGQLHAPTALPLERTLVPTTRLGGPVSQSNSSWRREQCFSSAGIQTPDRTSRSSTGYALTSPKMLTQRKVKFYMVMALEWAENVVLACVTVHASRKGKHL